MGASVVWYTYVDAGRSPRPLVEVLSMGPKYLVKVQSTNALFGRAPGFARGEPILSGELLSTEGEVATLRLSDTGNVVRIPFGRIIEQFPVSK